MNIVDRTIMGYADVGPYASWVVLAIRHDEDWPGTDSPILFACEHIINHQVVEAIGFFHEEECWRYLTGEGPATYTVFGLTGDEQAVMRTGRGIPDANVRRLAAVIHDDGDDNDENEGDSEYTIFSDGTRAELNDYAARLGIEEPEALPNKAAVVAAIRERT